MYNIWTEKYRPKTFKDVKGQEKIVEKAVAFVKQKNMPHLLFAGPAGIGKTTLSLVIAKELFKDYWHNNLLELNASDERGIDVVRNKVKDFARTKAIGDVPYKLIYLDECDSLTKEAQQALRRTMEQYSNNVRFILSCNYITKIIEPIQSRCAIFNFKPLEKGDVEKIIKDVSKKENLTVSNKAKDAIVEVSEGDVRRVINILQSCAAINKEIGDKLVYSLIGSANPEEIKKVLEIALSGDFVKSRNYLLDVMLRQGFSGLDIIKQISKEIWNLKIDDKHKLQLIDKCGEIEFRMVEGSDDFIQLQALLANFTKIS